jgi:hypothetical protein
MFPDDRERDKMPPVSDVPPPSEPPQEPREPRPPTPPPPPQQPPPAPAAPPPPSPPHAAPPQPVYPAPVVAPAGPTVPPADRIRNAWQRRTESDYIFNFWTALGWTILTCTVYGVYVLYQLIRRSRDHNMRRLEMLDAATTFAWEQAHARGLGVELRPNFERIAPQLAVLRNQTTQFRDPSVWLIIAIAALVLGGWQSIVLIVAFVLLDGDLITHDHAEGAIENELAAIYTRLGAPVPAPDPARLKGPHNYIGRIIATFFTCGIYAFWWEYDIMTEGNRHFETNWRWEDHLAQSTQQLIGA